MHLWISFCFLFSTHYLFSLSDLAYSSTSSSSSSMLWCGDTRTYSGMDQEWRGCGIPWEEESWLFQSIWTKEASEDSRGMLGHCGGIVLGKKGLVVSSGVGTFLWNWRKADSGLGMGVSGEVDTVEKEQVRCPSSSCSSLFCQMSWKRDGVVEDGVVVRGGSTKRVFKESWYRFRSLEEMGSRCKGGDVCCWGWSYSHSSKEKTRRMYNSSSTMSSQDAMEALGDQQEIGGELMDSSSSLWMFGTVSGEGGRREVSAIVAEGML